MDKPTQEMLDHFEKRTRDHIARFKSNIDRFIAVNPEFSSIVFDITVENHDISKFIEPEFTPYVFISWSYKMRDEGKEFVVSDEMKKHMFEATFHHIVNNRHHPEAWDENFNEEKLNSLNRDGLPKEMVDATKMPKWAIIQMVCDWVAIAQERENSSDVTEWMKKNVNKRWKFTDKQVEFIEYVVNFFKISGD